MVPALPSPRTAAAAAVALLVAGVTPAAAQSWIDTGLEPALSIPIQFGVSLVVQLVLGAIVLGAAPRYVRRTTDRVRNDPGGTFLFGLLALVAAFVAAIVLAITVVGIVVLIPAALVMMVVSIVGNVVGTVALGAALGGGRANGSALLIGALVMAVVGLVPLVGPLVQFLVHTAGLGAVVGSYWENR